jgi:hypothetical protein
VVAILPLTTSPLIADIELIAVAEGPKRDSRCNCEGRLRLLSSDGTRLMRAILETIRGVYVARVASVYKYNAKSTVGQLSSSMISRVDLPSSSAPS